MLWLVSGTRDALCVSTSARGQVYDSKCMQVEMCASRYIVVPY